MRETGTVEHQGELEPQPNKIAVLDAGSQYGGLIDRNIREAGYRTSLLPIETSAEELADYEVIIISGGPNSVYDDGAPDCDPAIFETKKPILGICYGMQLISPDFMTGISATPGSTIDEGVVMEIARKIKNQVEGISRVLYDLSNKPPGTTEWE